MKKLDQYIQILKNNNLKITPQRLAVLHYLNTHHKHPTAEQIYKVLKKKTPSLSKTTVYNTLKILNKHHIIHAISITGHERRYDLRKDIHHHFLCRNCETIQDIDLQCPNIQKIQEQGYKIEEIHGYFKGLCPKCQNTMGVKTT